MRGVNWAMPSTDASHLRLRPWNMTNTSLIAALNSPAMTEHTGGPEDDQMRASDYSATPSRRAMARCSN